MKRAALLLIGLALSACESGGIGMPTSPAWFATATAEQQAAYFQKVCTSYGYTANTPAMAQCIQAEALSGRQMASNRASAAFRTMAASQPRPPLRCTSQPGIGGVYTTCY